MADFSTHPPHFLQAASANSLSDVENEIPSRPAAYSTAKGRLVLGLLNSQRSPLSSAGSSQVGCADSCASTRPIHPLSTSPAWRQQVSLFNRDHGVQGIDTMLRSQEDLTDIHSKNTRKTKATQRLHWFHKINIFQKFRKIKEQPMADNSGHVTIAEALSCYNTFRTGNIDQLFRELADEFDVEKTQHWGDDKVIPAYAPLHELGTGDLMKLKHDVFDLHLPDDVLSDAELSARVLPLGLSDVEKVDGDYDLESDGNGDLSSFHDAALEERDALSMIPIFPTAFSNSLRIADLSEVNSPPLPAPSTGSIQSSHDLMIAPRGSQVASPRELSLSYNTLQFPEHISSELSQVLSSFPSLYGAVRHVPVPASSVYSPLMSDSEMQATQDSICLTRDSDFEATLSFRVPAFMGARIQRGHLPSEASTTSLSRSGLSYTEDSSPFIVHPRQAGINTCPPAARSPDSGFPKRLESLLNRFKDLNLERPND